MLKKPVAIDSFLQAKMIKILVIAVLLTIIPSLKTDAADLGDDTREVYARGKIIEVISESDMPEISNEKNVFKSQKVTVDVGDKFQEKDLTIDHIACINNPLQGVPLKAGDRVILYMRADQNNHITEAYVQDLDRTLPIAVLLGIFIGILLAMGGRRGFAAVVIISFTGFSIIYFLIPYVLNGASPLLCAIIICIAVTFISIPLVSGINNSSLAAMIGVLSGVIIAGGLSYLAAGITRIIGVEFEYANLMYYIDGYAPIDVRGIFFAGLLIGTLGAMMDTCISISSSIREMVVLNESLNARQLYKAGMNIGKDVMGMMCSTLILAYAGSYIPLLLLLYANHIPALSMLNSDMIVAEIIRSLTGSIGICLCIPITALSAAYLTTRKQKADYYSSIDS